MDSSRRVRATSVLPRCGPPCLFKGHLSTKSNAFCTDSSSLRLSTLQLVKNHMAVHYNKILSAKAAVDCSIPISMSTSVKYADQQRREKLKKELARCEKEFKLTKTAVQANSKNNSKSLFHTLKKPSGELHIEDDVLKEEMNGFSSLARSLVPSSERLHLSLNKSDKVITNGPEKNSSSSPFKSELGAAEAKNVTDSEMNIKQASNCMTYDTKEKIIPLPLQGHDLTWDGIKDDALQHSSPRAISQYSLKLPSTSKIYSDEEELLYLSFIEDVTDEILKLGLFSDRFLERLFERHIKQNKHLEEEKMRHLLHVLKVDLGCTSEKNLVKQNGIDRLDLFDFEKAGNSKPKKFKNESEVTILQERQEYQKALDMFLSVPKDESEIFSSPTEFFMPIYKSKDSEGVTIQQMNDETRLEPATLDENNPSISDSLTDQQTSVNIIEGDSDTEKVEISNGLCCLNTSLSQSVQFSSVKGDNNHDMELSALKIMEMSIEDCPLDV
uniref:Spermatosis associated 7 n=1 Tax=Aotus nancymaae TaxID=37293 RepID=A0A2K5DW85_AOTNA